MNDRTAFPHRICISCRASEPVGSGEPIWPVGRHCPACGCSVPECAGFPLFAPELAETANGFDAVAFDRLASIELTHFWFVARNELIVGLANRFFPNARRYLEVGCGNGAVLQALASSRSWDRLVGTDLHPPGLAHAKQRLPQGVEFAQLDARTIPAAAAFDLTGAYDVVEHIAEDEAVLRAIRGTLAAGGGTIIAVPQHPALWSRADEIGHHQRRYRVGELESKLQRNGFAVEFSSSFTSLLLPLMALNRLKARLSPAETDVSREVDVNPILNRALTAVLRAEVRLTLAGLRWALGGSRVVAARAI